VTVTLRLRRLVVARGTVGPGTARLPLTRNGRRALAGRRSVRLSVTAGPMRRTLRLR
jgi:hypothetical protein